MREHKEDADSGSEQPSVNPARQRWFVIFGIAAGLVAAAVIMLVAEIVFLELNRARESAVTGNQPDLVQFSETLGYELRPDLEERVYKHAGGETVYDVVYRSDSSGRRLTPMPTASNKERFVAFFGGSFTFGEGVGDSDTLPSHTASLMPNYAVYNYGFSGYGPQQTLAKLESGDITDEIAEDTGIGIYVFMPHHVRRAIGAMRVWVQWGRHFPYYRLESDGSLNRHGTFFTGRPWRSRIYDVLKHEQILGYFNADIPFRISKRHFALTAEILAQSKDEFLKAYPNGRFIVLVYPQLPEDEFEGSALTPYFETRGLEVLDFSSLIDMSKPEYRIPHDGHPTGAAHKAVARALGQALQEAPN